MLIWKEEQRKKTMTWTKLWYWKCKNKIGEQFEWARSRVQCMQTKLQPNKNQWQKPALSHPLDITYEENRYKSTFNANELRWVRRWNWTTCKNDNLPYGKLCIHRSVFVSSIVAVDLVHSMQSNFGRFFFFVFFGIEASIRWCFFDMSSFFSLTQFKLIEYKLVVLYWLQSK